MVRTCTAALLACMVAMTPVFFAFVSSDESLDSPRSDGMNVQSRTVGSADVPEWRVSDNWIYDGYLDVSDFAASSGVSTNVQNLGGSLSRTVVDMYVTDLEGNNTLVYEVESIGNYQSDGSIDLADQSGCLFVDMSTTEIIRASDLATYTQTVGIDVFFDPWCWALLRQTVGELTVVNTFNPPLENYDFPISVGESWEMDYQQETEFSGVSNFGIPIPDDTNESNSTSWTAVSQGGSGAAYSGCYQSLNVSNYDSSGAENGFNWYCPEVKGEVKSSIVQAFGFIAVHELVSYQPVQTGKQIEIDVQYPISPTGIDLSAWINVTDQGQPVPNQELQFRYESEQFFHNITTDSNGSYLITFDSGDNPDDTIGRDELGSHGLIAWIESEKAVGAETLLIDSEVHEIDLGTRSAGVIVNRFRPPSEPNGQGQSAILDPSVGLSAIAGDILTFSVPVINRGLITSPSSIIEVTSPDGSRVYGNVPPLFSLQESRVEINWTVPSSQQFGNVYLYFEVDPMGEITQDGNRTNNQGSLFLFIGATPNPILNAPSETLTIDQVSFDGSPSSDPDGGGVACEFSVELEDGSSSTVPEEDCILEWSWADDGEFLVILAVTDQEGDTSTTEVTVSVINRPPEIVIGSVEQEVVVTNPITFSVIDGYDLDSQDVQSPLDLLWSEDCLEGKVGLSCTITPMVEGVFWVEITATDDDGATTTAQHSVNVSNIAPSNPVVELYVDDSILFPDSREVYFVNEAEEVTFVGRADDSSNDIDSLVHIWKPFAEDIPELSFSSTGEMSTLSGISYNNSGLNLATLQVFDDNGLSTELLIVPIQVLNVAPEISPITTSLGELEEDEEFSISPIATDTENDQENLTYCYDLDPSIDSDSDGLGSNDCDVPSRVLVHSWPDSSTAPASIFFHVTDDDGASDSIEINFQVVNSPPDAYASVGSQNPIEGAPVILSANGTIDSSVDMESLVFHWDIDVTVDSDGDGDPANDVDYVGRWIEFSYESGGPKKAKLTVLDDSSSNSVTMDIDVAEAPVTIAGSIRSNTYAIAVTLIALMGIGYLLIFRPAGNGGLASKKEDTTNIDEAFDNPQIHEEFSFQDFSSPGRTDFPSEAPPSMEGLEDVLRELSGEDAQKVEEIELPPAPDLDKENAILDLDDIEALFEE